MTATLHKAVYTVLARTVGDGTAQVAAGEQVVAFDASWAGAPSGLPGPAELLASAFAACLLRNVERSSQLLPFHCEGADVEVRARRQDAPPKFVEISYELRLVTGEPQRRVELLHRNLHQHGTVYNTLAAVCDVHGDVVTIAPDS